MLKPNFPEALNNLGNSLQKQGDLTAAIVYTKALTKPDHSEAHNNLGNALKENGHLTTALITKKPRPDPKNSKAYYYIGLIQAATGNLSRSNFSFQKAFELDTKNTAALFELSRNILDIKEFELLVQKINKHTITGLNRKNKSMAEFALANFYHKSKNYSKAAQHLASANKLKLSFHPSDLSSHLLRIQTKAR